MVHDADTELPFRFKVKSVPIKIFEENSMKMQIFSKLLNFFH